MPAHFLRACILLAQGNQAATGFRVFRLRRIVGNAKLTRVFPGLCCKITPACDRRGCLLFLHLAKAAIELQGVIALKRITVIV